MTPRRSLQPLQQRSKESADRILRAAVDVITDVGIKDFTMTAVAHSAGVSIGGLYGRYPDKDALLYAVKDHVLTDLANDVEEAVGLSEATVDAVIATYVDVLTRVLFGAQRLYAFIFIHSADDAELRDRGFSFHRQLRALLVAKLTGTGVVDSRAVSTVYEVIVQSLLMRVISLGHLNPGSVPYEGFPAPGPYAESLVDFVCRALAGGPTENGDDGSTTVSGS